MPETALGGPVYPLLALASTALAIVTLGYVVLCVVSPFGSCRRCHGHGHHITRRGRRRLCRRCDATGLRIRTGRHLVNAAQRTYRAGTR